MAGAGWECSLGRGGSARLAGEGVLAWPSNFWGERSRLGGEVRECGQASTPSPDKRAFPSRPGQARSPAPANRALSPRPIEHFRRSTGAIVLFLGCNLISFSLRVSFPVPPSFSLPWLHNPPSLPPSPFLIPVLPPPLHEVVAIFSAECQGPYCWFILRRAGRDLADAVLMISSSSDQVNAASKLFLSPSVFPNHKLLCCACEVF